MIDVDATATPDFFPFSPGPYYAICPEGGIVGNCEFTCEEWDAPYQPTLTVLTKEVSKDSSVCKTVVDQFPTLGEMVRIEALSPNELTVKMSVLHCLMMSHGGELLALYHDLLQSHREYVQSMDSMLKVTGLNDKFSTFDVAFARSKAKGNERKKKIKSFTQSLDILHAKAARMSADLNRATILKAKRDEEILRLKATPPEFASFFRANAGFERGLSMHRTKEVFAAVLKKISYNVPASRDACISSPIVKESIVTLASTSLELLSNTIPTSSTATLEPKKEWVNVMVDGSDHEMRDGAANAKPRRSERVSSGPNDVVVALSTREKGDGYVPSSVVDE
ncbi:hypothetical protein Tco_0623358 [Tanacetum coccineum]